MKTSRLLSLRLTITGLLVQAALLLIGSAAHAVPIVTDHAPGRGRVIVEDFSGYRPHSRHDGPLVIANGTVVAEEGTNIYDDICNVCIGLAEEDWEIAFVDLPKHTLFWSTDYFESYGAALTTWTVSGRSGVSVFSNLYRPNFAFFDPRGLVSIAMHVTLGFDAEREEEIREYFRFDNITTFSVPESGGAVVFCAGLLALLASIRRGRNMLRALWMKVFLVSMLCASATSVLALPMPTLPESAFVGTLYNSDFSVDFRYDSNTERMTYVGGGGSIFAAADFYNVIHPAKYPLAPGVFAWTASVNRHGEISGTGSMSLLLDIGNGLELLATGNVTEVGFEEMFCEGYDNNNKPEDCFWVKPWALIETTYVDSRIAPLLGNTWLSLVFIDFFGPPDGLLPSVHCGWECHWTGDAILGYQVPEPGPLGLLVLGLAGLGFARRRRTTN